VICGDFRGRLMTNVFCLFLCDFCHVCFGLGGIGTGHGILILKVVIEGYVFCTNDPLRSLQVKSNYCKLGGTILFSGSVFQGTKMSYVRGEGQLTLSCFVVRRFLVTGFLPHLMNLKNLLVGSR